MRQGRQGNFFYFHVSFVIGSFRIERAIPTFSRSTCRPPGRWLNGSLDIDCRAGSGLSGASLNRGLSPAATIGRPPPADSPGVFVGLAIKRRVDCVRVKPRDIAKIYDRPSACGFPNNVNGWMGWTKLGRVPIICSWVHPIPNQPIAFRTIVVPPAGALVERLIEYRLSGGLGSIGDRSTAGSRPRLPSVVRLRRTLPAYSLVWRLNAGLIVFESNPGISLNLRSAVRLRLLQQRQWLDGMDEARSCSNHLFVGSSHPKPAYRIPDHRCAARPGVG